MDARYLRVKNWSSFQHYSKRRPPWIKSYARLLMDDRFCELDEAARGQLMMIWLVASQASRATLDEKGNPCPVIAYDERSLRTATRGTKKLPLDMFVREGWLIPVSEEELIDETVTTSIQHSLRLAARNSREMLEAC